MSDIITYTKKKNFIIRTHFKQRFGEAYANISNIEIANTDVLKSIVVYTVYYTKPVSLN